VYLVRAAVTKPKGTSSSIRIFKNGLRKGNCSIVRFFVDVVGRLEWLTKWNKSKYIYRYPTRIGTRETTLTTITTTKTYFVQIILPVCGMQLSKIIWLFGATTFLNGIFLYRNASLSIPDLNHVEDDIYNTFDDVVIRNREIIDGSTRSVTGSIGSVGRINSNTKTIDVDQVNTVWSQSKTNVSSENKSIIQEDSNNISVYNVSNRISSRSDDSIISSLHQNRQLNRSVLFIHIGKAGGETMKEVFEFTCSTRLKKKRKENCYKNLPKDSRLTKLVHGYAHGDGPSTPMGFEHHNNTTSFLFNIRHPMDRFISWFEFVNPIYCKKGVGTATSCRTNKRIEQNQNESFLIKDFFDTCFTEVYQLFVAILPLDVQQQYPISSSLSTTDFCKHVARIVVASIEPYSGKTQESQRLLSWPFILHAQCNYRKYYTRFFQKCKPQEVLVVRTNTLWDDLVNLEQYVGGSSNFSTIIGSKYTHGSERRYKTNRNISSILLASMSSLLKNHTNNDAALIVELLIQNFCCALMDEMLVYKDILFHASNLNEQTKNQQWLYDLNHCYFTSIDHMLNTCNAIPLEIDTSSETIDLLRVRHHGSSTTEITKKST
jgi:Sulfotransferase family